MAGAITGTVKYSNLADGTYVIKSAGNQSYVLARAGDADGSNVRIEALSSSATSRTHQQWKIRTFAATNIGEQKNTCYKGNDYRIFSASSEAVALNLYGNHVWASTAKGTGSANAAMYTYSASDTAFMHSIMSCPAGQYNIVHRDTWNDESKTKISKSSVVNVEYAKYVENQNVIFWYQWSDTYITSQYASNVTIKTGDGMGSNSANSRWIFERAIFYVKFNGNGATSGSMGNQTIYMDVATALTSNAFARAGYTWTGWATSASGAKAYSNAQSVTNLTTIHKGTVNLYAVWTGITWYVRYNANGGSGSMANSSHVYGTAKNLTANAFTRAGYTFKNWNRNAAGTSTAYSNGQSVSNLTATSGGIIDVYAQWTANTYTINFDANGGKGAPASVTRTYGTARNLPSDAPTRSGHTFLGWSKSATATTATWAAGASYLDSEAANTTLYAVWRNDYVKPVVSDYAPHRAVLEDGVYVEDDEGTYGRFAIDWRVTENLDEDLVNEAAITATCVSSAGDALEVILTGQLSGVTGHTEGTIEGLVPDLAYTVTLIVTDKVGTYSYKATIQRTEYILDVGSKGKAMGIGIAAPDNGLEVGYETVFDKDVSIVRATPGAEGGSSIMRFIRRFVDNSKADNGVTANDYHTIGWHDAADRFVAYLQSVVRPDGSTEMDIAARTLNADGTAKVDTTLRLYAYKNGTRTAQFDATNLVGPSYLRLDATDNNFSSINFKSKNRNAQAIRFYGADNGDGDGIVIGDGGIVVIGGGESAINWYTRITGGSDGRISGNADSEQLYLTSDNNIYFITNAQTVANRAISRLGPNGSLYLGSIITPALNASSNNGATSTVEVSYVNFEDKNGSWIGRFGAQFTGSAGQTEAFFGCRNMKTDGSYTNSNYIFAGMSKAGAPTYRVTNAANFRSAIGAAASSDRRLKTDIQPLGEDAIEFIKRLEPSVYTINGERQVGLIAQDVHEADTWGTRMAFETVEGIDGLDDWEKIEGGAPTWKLDYIRLLPPTITALQQAMEKIEQLEARVAELEEKLGGM